MTKATRTRRAAAPAKAPRTSIEPHEIVFSGTLIELTSSEPLDPESAGRSIQLQGHRGQVHLQSGGRCARLEPEGGLPHGHQTLIVGELVSKDGRRIADGHVVPFYVTDSVAKVDPNLRVESIVRLRVGTLDTQRIPAHQRPKGTYVEFMKAVDRRSGRPVDLAFDQDGRPVDRQAILQKIDEARAREFGKLHPSLHGAAGRARGEERIEVALWIKAPTLDETRFKLAKTPPKEVPKEVAAHRLARAAECSAFAARLPRDAGTAPRVDAAAPVVYASLTPKQIREAAGMPEVQAMFLHEPKGFDDLTNSIAIAHSDDVHATGIKGKGVSVAVWEPGPDDTTNLAIAGFFDPTQSATSQHARHTCGIIKNTEANAPKGHAPSCTLYSANSYDLDALAWAVNDRHCTVISQSFHRDSEQTEAGLSYDDIYKDHLVLHYPYPTILQAAGNGPSAEFVNHKGFNSLAVGNHDDSAAAMASDSCFRNPDSPQSDRELPEIAANGTAVTAVGLTLGGTSMAAPVVAGVTALLQEKNGTLRMWPEGGRAILLAGASRNVSGSTWWSDVVADTDAADGTGPVDAAESVAIAGARKARDAAASQRGWDVGTLTSADFDSNGLSTFAYRVKVPKLVLGPRRVKVALAWDARVSTLSLFGMEILLGSRLAVDYDLWVFDAAGSLVGHSSSWDNSYEIAEFQGVPGAEYVIRVRRWSGTDATWYGLAWTVTGGIKLNPIPGPPIVR
jgi:hypothetical protein